MAGTGHSLRPAEDDLELAHWRYESRRNAHYSLRLHALVCVGFFSGLLLTLREAINVGGEAGQTVRLPLTALVQVSVILHELLHCRRLIPGETRSEIHQHTIKTKLHVFLHLAVVAMVILCSASGEFDAEWCAIASTFLSLASIADRVTLSDLCMLQGIKLAVFLSLVMFFKSSIQSKGVLSYATVGIIGPTLFGAHIEVRSRHVFACKYRGSGSIASTKFVANHWLLACLHPHHSV